LKLEMQISKRPNTGCMYQNQPIDRRATMKLQCKFWIINHFKWE